MSNKLNIQVTGFPGHKRYDHLFKAGFRLRAVVSLKEKQISQAEPVAVAILFRKDSPDVFTSVIHERGGEWFYGEALPYAGAEV